ncbi:serine hydrolase domain-containing protein [Streptomyces sp. NPDC094032]|uniref:serine hydrolase domain-containing protein n=1 Tax=Streptomyces sp. NPDC094032 TaxID=3155308 RepID=UPI00332554B1
MTVKPTNPPDAAHWSARLTELAARHSVPGAGLGIWYQGRQIEAVTGLANAGARIEATTDTLWQIGSLTKVWTATAAMGLVDEGALTLDGPLIEVMPELRLGDAHLTRHVTLRHLLSHTSGIDGDFFPDTGRGDDCLERYAELLADLPASHPLGATMSYCNAGYTLIGRVMERVTGITWDALMRDRLFRPLGLTHTATLAEDVLRHRAATGHYGDPPRVVAEWAMGRSTGPTGLICSTTADVLSFVRLHLGGGSAGDGTRMLSRDSVRAMQSPQVELPCPYPSGRAWGLGWALDEWDGLAVYGHDGSTIGQNAYLRVLPEVGLAICLFANGGSTGALYAELFREITRDLAGVSMPAPLLPAEGHSAAAPADVTGVYERSSTRIEVVEQDGGLLLRDRFTGILAGLAERPETELRLRPLAAGTFVARRPDDGGWMPVAFFTLPDGSRFVHHGGRATPKVS